MIFYDVMSIRTEYAFARELNGQRDGAGGAADRAVSLHRLQGWVGSREPDFKADVNITFRSCFLQ